MIYYTKYELDFYAIINNVIKFLKNLFFECILKLKYFS